MVDLGTKSLLEYDIPDTTTGLLFSIFRPPVTAQNFELKPHFIQFISNDSFVGTPHECSVSHIDSFLEKCDTTKLNGVTDDAIRLRLFPFSLRDRVKEWLRDEGSQMMSPYMKHGGGSSDCKDNALTMALTSKFDKFQATSSGSSAKTCQMCNVQGHIAPGCPQNSHEMSIEEANAFYTSNPKRPYDPHSNTYNEGWKHHPNFSYKNTQAQQNPPPPPP
ncbi:uncharacterized protein LOC110696807 [Chenopodium quinoa]|uniref:uncharacterized protein LOC110696807 n=1 Tax=Chenopodium quinoa TaxID=63459 RepID=UPI000B795251|nr:uncharacterized protein LOC110696807 [Chenopodium quinoa]